MLCCTAHAVAVLGSDNGLRAGGAALLCRVLAQLPQLQRLDLFRTFLLRLGGRVILLGAAHAEAGGRAEFLTERWPSDCMRGSDNAIGDKGVAALCRVLDQLTQLQWLSLSGMFVLDDFEERACFGCCTRA